MEDTEQQIIDKNSVAKQMKTPVCALDVKFTSTYNPETNSGGNLVSLHVLKSPEIGVTLQR